MPSSTCSTFFLVGVISIFANSIIAAPVTVPAIVYQVLPKGTASNCLAGTTKLDGQKSKDYICSPCIDNTFAGAGSAGACIPCSHASPGTDKCIPESSLALTCKTGFWKDLTLHCLPCAGNEIQQQCKDQKPGSVPIVIPGNTPAIPILPGKTTPKLTECVKAGQRLILDGGNNSCKDCPDGKFTKGGNKGEYCNVCTAMVGVKTCKIDGTVLSCLSKLDKPAAYKCVKA